MWWYGKEYIIYFVPEYSFFCLCHLLYNHFIFLAALSEAILLFHFLTMAISLSTDLSMCRRLPHQHLGNNLGYPWLILSVPCYLHQFWRRNLTWPEALNMLKVSAEDLQSLTIATKACKSIWTMSNYKINTFHASDFFPFSFNNGITLTTPFIYNYRLYTQFAGLNHTF